MIQGTHVEGWIPKAGTALGGLEPPRRTRPWRVLPGAVCEDKKTIDPHDSKSASVSARKKPEKAEKAKKHTFTEKSLPKVQDLFINLCYNVSNSLERPHDVRSLPMTGRSADRRIKHTSMIEINHLVKNYGSKFAVDDISFTVREGEIVGFLGPNGAGKSTTMNILTGYLSSTSGEAKVGGIDILENPDEAKKLIGFLPEQPPLYVDMTVQEYLNFVYDIKACRLNRERHLEEIRKVTKIDDVKNRLIRNLSKGYRQRVGIAQALVGNPPVIIFDEPTVGLDPKQIIEIRNLIRSLGKNHTVILSTHILSEVQSVCDRIVIINEGKIIADERTENITQVVEDNRRYAVKVAGPQREVAAALRQIPGVLSVEITGERELDSYVYRVEAEKGVDVRKPVFWAMAENNWPITGLETLGMNLEEVFTKIVDRSEGKK